MSNQSANLLIAFGRLAGLLSEFLILIQLLLISRFYFIEKEYGFDKLINIHKIIGFFLGFFIIIHPIFLTLGYAKSNNTNFLNQFLNFQTNWENVFGATIALIIIISVAIFSIKKIRSKFPYELWYFFHLPLYIAVAIAFGHQINTGDMSGGGAMFYWYFINIITFGILIAYRFVKPAYFFFKHSFVVEKIVKENNNVYSVYITGINMSQYKFKSGQYATLIFMQKNMWFHHPFSFSNSYNEKYLRFTIKSSGDFTSKIEKLKAGTRVWIDGPLGTFTLKKSFNNKYLFIAGGIGITPILSIIKSIKNKSNAILMYSNKTEEEINFKKEIAESGIETYYFNTNNGSDNRINLDKIIKICPDYKNRDIYLCGPAQMTSSLEKALKDAGIPSEQIHFEIFNY
jgi:predicted ferric reductase